ncbi:MAG: hypothetical protein NZ610_01410 [Candidatus Bipolaricaulota bacterium]|nr:hypothetical protein [Candidatus Bipolaricaulota bacterium]MCS7274051.1 hypothetical protein [Candidatus Bipolaricaulota bacterium]MDW8110648.1 hypothetical protein [Candidatus Bipolaricaulota bacterium]MDW8328494.1 hypothetical protein [Candidatus Bipolaricaulota bacterium]
MTDKIEPTQLAIAVFRSCVYELVLCETELDWQALRRWEFILKGADVRDYAITRRFQAFAEAKKRLRNPENVAAYLLYRLSHGGADEPALLAEAQAENQQGPHCIACGGPIDRSRRQKMLERIARGLRLKDLKNPLDCEDFLNTHLTQAEMAQFVGHQVSFSYQERMINGIFDELTEQNERLQ